MKAIMIMMDTLNRHMLKVYDAAGRAITPNIDRLARRSLVFDNHFIGSAPCMPARRDLMTGRINFLERGWGPIEPFDVTFPTLLREKGVFTHIATDHCHYAELGGEGYMQQYDTWDLIRGQETDVWASQVRDPQMPRAYLGQAQRQYQCNRQHFKTDADHPTPRTFAAATQWLRDNEGADNYFLQVEVFDPHEPFDCTEAFKALYPDHYQGPLYEWPRYDALNADEGPEAVDHLRNLYCATLSMADKWLGKLLDEMDRQNLWEDTLVIFTSDHGHMLGEHGVTGKNCFHAWNEMCRIPLFIHLPGDERASQRCAALTQTIDLMPTILEHFGCTAQGPIHGRSLWPLLYGAQKRVRDYALYGWFGMPVNLTDGYYTYFRAPKSRENAPLYAYMSMMTSYYKYWWRDIPEGALDVGRYLSWTDMPVYCVDMNQCGEPLRENVRREDSLFRSLLFSIHDDPGQRHPLRDDALEEKFIRALRAQLREHDAPAEQFQRLGL
ncbi:MULTISPECIES: sulfatase [unclassified Clostridium]|uniref:sulfatase n=1 Tax=unclassified Clostridium TaxID=2614128 RepID=UPI001106687D|nr:MULTISPECIES: sulfatase [unclassified Clostridium]